MIVPWALRVVKSQQSCQNPLLPFLSLPGACFFLLLPLCQQKCLCSLTANLIHKWIQVKINLVGEKRFVLAPISSLICLRSPVSIAQILLPKPQAVWLLHHLYCYAISCLVIPLLVVDPGCSDRHRTHSWCSGRLSLLVWDKMGTSSWLTIFCSAGRRTSPQCCWAQASVVAACPILWWQSEADGRGMNISAFLCAERHIIGIMNGCSRLNIAECVELPGEGCVPAAVLRSSTVCAQHSHSRCVWTDVQWPWGLWDVKPELPSPAIRAQSFFNKAFHRSDWHQEHHDSFTLHGT